MRVEERQTQAMLRLYVGEIERQSSRFFPPREIPKQQEPCLLHTPTKRCSFACISLFACTGKIRGDSYTAELALEKFLAMGQKVSILRPK